MNSVLKKYHAGYDSAGAPTFREIPGYDPNRPGICTACLKTAEECLASGECLAGQIRDEMVMARSEARIANAGKDHPAPKTPATAPRWIN
jgi:hypothetical protein